MPPLLKVCQCRVLSAALYQRFSSRGDADYQDKLLSEMRYQFGGHVEAPLGKQPA